MSIDTARDGIGTQLAHLGRPAQAGARTVVNPPVMRASTVLFPSVADMEADAATPYDGLHYGRQGTQTTFALEEAAAALDGAYRAIALPSGLAAISVAVLGYLAAGDHMLVVDSAYGPTRRLADLFLKRFGVETTYYAPGVGAGIAELFRPNTKVIYTESPGSLTFELSDIAAITAVAKARGIATVMDNTWATPLFFKPLDHGVDIAIQAATKYVVGHSDAMMGLVSCTRAAWPKAREAAGLLGYHAGPDECALALRGLRTMEIRLRRHQDSALIVADWLAARPEVRRVLHPARPDHPDHALFTRDFLGSSGLFGVVIDPVTKPQLAAMLDGLRLFGMGYSWGGFESLIIAPNPHKLRTASPWTEPGQLLRLHIGLEDPADLIADLDAGFARLHAAA